MPCRIIAFPQLFYTIFDKIASVFLEDATSANLFLRLHMPEPVWYHQFARNPLKTMADMQKDTRRDAILRVSFISKKKPKEGIPLGFAHV